VSYRRGAPGSRSTTLREGTHNELAQQTEQARAANEHVAAQRLEAAAEKAGELERAAAEDAQACAGRHQRSLRERTQAETEASAAHAALERATAACAESDRRFEKARAAEEATRTDAASAAERLRECRTAREQLETELLAARERAKVFDGTIPSLAAIDELRVLEERSGLRIEAARRAAERRAADAARGVTR
jgi:hypothetical protein